MTIKSEHQWEMVDDGFEFARKYQCSMCLATRWYEWSPGWPGVYSYFTPDGDRSATEPPCEDGPIFETM